MWDSRHGSIMRVRLIWAYYAIYGLSTAAALWHVWIMTTHSLKLGSHTMIDYWNGLATPVWDPRPKLRRGDQRVSPNRKSDANLYDSGDAQRGSPKPGG